MFFPSIGRDAYDSALLGMHRAEMQVWRGATKISRGDLDPGAFVDLMRGQRYFAANIKVAQTQREMDRSLLDIIA
jgi:hypothetical protein